MGEAESPRVSAPWFGESCRSRRTPVTLVIERQRLLVRVGEFKARHRPAVSDQEGDEPEPPVPKKLKLFR